MFLLSIFVCSVFALTEAATVKEPNVQFTPCKVSDPNFNQCLKKELQNVVKPLRFGYPRFRIPPVDPFFLPELKIAKGSGAVAIDLNLHDVKVTGLSSAVFKEVTIDPKTLVGKAKIVFAQPINLDGQYTAKGKVQVLPIDGKGPCNITIYEAHLDLTELKATSLLKSGQEFIDLNTVTLKIVSVKKLKLKLDNLFKGNKDLSNNLNVFLNENWQLLLDELKPAFEEAISLILKDILVKMLQKIPRSEVFPA